MPTYQIKAPNGKTYRIDGPPGASDDDVRAAVLAQFPNAGRPSVAKEAPYDPTADSSFLGNMAAGAGKALVDLYEGGKQLLGIGDQAALQREIDERKRLDAPLMHTAGGVLGNIAGNVAATAVPGGLVARGAMSIPLIANAVRAATTAAPILSGIGAGAATGAATDALEPVASDESRGDNVVRGSLIGAAGGAIPGLLSKIVGGAKLAPEAQKLADEGVRLTPGQALGGAFKRVEEKTTSVPLLGPMIRRAQTRGIEDFNRAGFNRALAPIGEKVGPDFNIGNEGVAAVRKKIGAAYDAALDKIGIVRLDGQFADEVGKLAGMTAELGDGPAKQFAAILKNRVLDQMTDAGTMSADTMKAVESELGRQAARWSGSSDAAQRGLASAIREVQASLRGAVERSAGPEAAQALKNANQAWANFVRIQDAAARTGALEGVFTPKQLRASVRGMDKSLRKGAFAEGDALMQDLADAGSKTIASEVPNSGTVDRLLNAAAPFGLPYLDPTTLATLGAAALPYTNVGGKAAFALLTQRPQALQTLSEALRLGAPAGGIASGLLAPNVSAPRP